MGYTKSRSLLKWLVIIMVVLILGSFILSKTRELITGISIVISSPPNGSTVTEKFTTIVGDVPGATTLFIAGAKVLPEGNGHFEHEILLGIGYNIIEVKAHDRFDRSTTKRLELVYDPVENDPLPLPAATSTATTTTQISNEEF